MPTRIGTSERDGTFFTQGLALKTVLDAESALRPVEVLETPGASVENAERLESGAIDFGFMAANWVPRAIRGEPPFAQPLALRIVAPMNVGPLFFIVRADSALRSIADLAGTRVVFGPERSGMAQHARVMLDALGIAGVRPVYLDFAAGAAALEAGAADAQLQCPIPNQVMTDLSRRVLVRVLRYDAGMLERVLAAVPYYRRTVMPPGAIRGLERDLPQAGVLNLLVTHARMDARAVAAVARAVATGAASLERLNPLFRGLDDLIAEMRRDGAARVAGSDAALHAGAASAYLAQGFAP